MRISSNIKIINSANYATAANWNALFPFGKHGNVTTVGTNGGPSAYGTFDQSGNVEEWIGEFSGPGDAIFRGGNFNLGAEDISKYGRPFEDASGFHESRGYRVATFNNPLSIANFLTVGNAGNANDSTGYGGVNYQYQIGKYPVTNYDYKVFLNAVAAVDSYGLFQPIMSSSPSCGITRSGTSGSYMYSTRDNMHAKPVNCVSWFSAARYCNWLHNNYGDTETGAYELNGVTLGNIPEKNLNARYWIPTENEWYKAAYYTPNKNGSGPGYWAYATQSDTPPMAVTANSVGDGRIPPNAISPKVQKINNAFKIRM